MNAGSEMTSVKEAAAEPNKSDPEALLAATLLPGATKLKRCLEETDELIVCPGVHDGFSARIALDVGFTALYMVRQSSV